MTTLSMTREKNNMIQTVQQYGKQLFGFIRSRVRTNEDAEDILQDVWYQFTRVSEVEQIEQLGSWLYRVARNRITDSARKQKAETLSDVSVDEDDEDGSFLESLMADTNTPETEHLRQLFWEEVLAALEELPAAQREVFVWNELEDLTFQEISDMTGDNIKTLISRKRYAVQYLRKRLATLHDEILQY